MKALFAGFICGMVIVGLSKRGRKPRRIGVSHRGPAAEFELRWKAPAIEDVPVDDWYWAATGEC